MHGTSRASKREGVWFIWNEDGTLSAEESGNYEAGERTTDLTAEQLEEAARLAEQRVESMPE